MPDAKEITGNEDDIVILDALRTPFGRFGGTLKDIPSVDLAGHVTNAIMARAGIEKHTVDEVILGTCIPSETGIIAPVIARQVLLKAGFPPETVSVTLDRACCSSLAAVQFGMRAIRLGEADIVLALGVENMSRTPMQIPQLRWGTRLGNVTIEDSLFELGYKDFSPVSVDAGEVALEHGITREDQDRWALGSQQRYQEAAKAGKFKDEIVPIEVPQYRKAPILFETDEFPKPQTTLEGLTKLRTVYGSPTVTPGNAPGLDSGASAILITRRKKANELGKEPLAVIESVASVAVDPRRIAEVPAPAIQKALKMAGRTLSELDLIEINEAFAAMPLVASKILADGDEELLRALRNKINVNGGAIAIGHPVGASGARILLTLMYELRRRYPEGGGVGAAAICGGLAQGDCAIIHV